MNQWIKQGVIIKPNPDLWWMKSHAMIPTPWMLENGLLKLLFSGRDEHNRSQIGYAILDLKDNAKIIEFASEPILKNGDLGCFDDNGVTPSCVLPLQDRILLFYIGWNPGSTTRMHIYGGLSHSFDGGKTFERYSRAPIIERCRVNPFINTAPFVVKDEDAFKMYYVSGVEWVHKDLPRYNIQMATSSDGYEWKREGHVCIDFAPGENALARPFVIKEDGIYKMWFASKGENYRLRYAESTNGINWQRKDQEVGITVSSDPQAEDHMMIEYAAVVSYKNKKFMFYNGNNYGQNGILMATQEN